MGRLQKVTYRLAILTAIVGLLLFFSFGSLKGLLYYKILIIHILLGLVLAGVLIRLMYTHVPEELSNSFKRGVKKWNGFKTLLYLILAILSGMIVFLFHIRWVMYFHGFIGLWALVVGWKHKR